MDTTSFVPAPVSNYASPQVLLEWLGNFEDVVHDREAFELCNKTRQLLKAINQVFEERISNLSKQLTHGDWRIGNVVFKNNQVATILDFDFLDVRERVFDLAYTLYWMFVDLEPLGSNKELSWHKVTEMLRSYNQASTYKLTKAEVEVLPLEIALVPLYWIGEALIVPDLTPTLLNYAKSVEMAKWMLEKADHLSKVFSP